jgi:hypothetical protein
MSGPVFLQRLEGLVLLAAAVIGFGDIDASWWLVRCASACA